VLGLVTNRQLLAAIAIVQASNDAQQASIDALHLKADALMTEQAGIDAAAQEIEADVAKENTALTAIQAEIASLQNANPALDLTGLNAAVADLDTAAAAEQAAVPPAG
jgi:hypothetical protein